MFEVASCSTCHNIQGEGGNIGADLSRAGEEFQGAELLREILEPSRNIKDEHRLFTVFLQDGSTYSGLIVERNDDTVHIIEDLQRPEEISILQRSDIDLMKPQKVSAMSTGLLVLLTREEILDLVAFLRANGRPDHPAFSR
jgi:putative heme-binding domain-containing protein